MTNPTPPGQVPARHQYTSDLASKRAKIAMVLNVTAASDMFSQDLEDLDAELVRHLAEDERQEQMQIVRNDWCARAAAAVPVMTRHRTKDGILHFLTKEQMAEEIIRLDAALAAAPAAQAALLEALKEAQAGLEFAAARLPHTTGFVPSHIAALNIVNAALAAAPTTQAAPVAQGDAEDVEIAALESSCAHLGRLIDELRPDAERYQYLRERDLDTIRQGGVFAGRTPDNVVLNGDDLDAAIDAARAQAKEGASHG